jgi:tetratricopeptide (TPR) repeat protein
MAEVYQRRGDLESAGAAADSARFYSPDFFAAWEAKENVLAESKDTAALRAHYAAGIDQFRREEDLRVRYQTRLAELERAGGDGRVASEIEERMIRENRRLRTDLSAAAGAEVLSRLMQEGDYDAAMREYRSLSGKLGPTGGGNFFYEVVRPFVRQMKAAGREKDARRALDLAGRVMKFESDSILAREFAEMEAGLAGTQ